MPENTVIRILAELENFTAQIDQSQLEKAADLIAGQSQSVFCTGAGRSGLIAQALANRLLHLGKPVSVIGEITAPPIQKDDLLIAVSGSGCSGVLLRRLKQAKAQGAKILLISMEAGSEAASLADQVVVLPGTNRLQSPAKASSFQPVGSLFEQLAWLCADALVFLTKEKLGLSNEDLLARHANIE